MLGYLTLIFCRQLAGEPAVTALGLPVPGPVAGMALLFAGLLVHGALIGRDLAGDHGGAGGEHGAHHRGRRAGHGVAQPAGEGGRLMPDLHGLRDVWVYLSASPLLHLTLMLVAYQAGSMVYRRAKLNPLLNPVLIAVVLLVAVLIGTGTAYATYFDGAQFEHFLLCPATVAVGWALGVSREALISIAPKSVTAPVAMGIAEQLGGLPSLTAVLVISTGILGAMIGPKLLTLIGVTDWAARGLAIGTASHGIGTARALQVSEVAGAFSGLAMGLNALATAVLLPLLWRVFLAG